MTSSTVFLHVGQCGNQVALPLWSLAAAERRGASSAFAGASVGADRAAEGPHPLFDPEDGYARALFVDSEPKAVGETLKALPSGCTRATTVPVTNPNNSLARRVC